MLEQFPEMGRMVPEVGRKDFRELIWKGYRVMYRLKPDEVVVHIIRHGRQEWVDPQLEDD